MKKLFKVFSYPEVVWLHKKEQSFLSFIALAFIVAMIATDHTHIARWVGFLFAAYAAIANDSIFQAFWTGIVFGVVTYGTYNLTNMATIKDWSPTIVFVDMLWGGCLTGFSSAAGIYLSKIFFSN